MRMSSGFPDFPIWAQTWKGKPSLQVMSNPVTFGFVSSEINEN